MKEEGHPATFCSILIFPTYTHLASLLLLLQLVLLLHRRVGTLQWLLPFAVTHLELLTTGLCPGTLQLTYFRRLSTNNLVALNSVSVYQFQNQALLARKQSFTWTFLFSNARWLFENLQLSNRSVSVILHIFLNIYCQLFC
jgi:hypothetical protein